LTVVPDVASSAVGEASAEALAAAALNAARRFAAGATLWCVAPDWDAHARHVAVEFVHPVIMGKRALPAVSVEAADPVAALRLVARPGDLLCVVSAADDRPARRLLGHAEAWGLTRLWLGAGPPPPAGAAEHVCWVSNADPAVAARSGEVVMLYHLLWELTHVVFEHPGLLAEPPAGEVCITCADEGRVGEVTAVDAAGAGQAVVVVGGQATTVDMSLLSPTTPGDLVLVHAGVALAALAEEGSS
jgi:hydrogenase maturation factor